jgi:hypothetical protein
MRVCDVVACEERRCADVAVERHTVPEALVRPDDVAIVMVAEAPPPNPEDWFYAGSDALFARTTVAAFREAGEDVDSVDDLLELGVYLTTAVKCGKTAPAVPTEVVQSCSALLEVELGLFPFARALMLMGGVAIKAVNAIAVRNGEPPVVPAGPTYRVRQGDHRYRGMKVYPSYLQSGSAYLIERNVRETIAMDIAAALAYVRTSPAAA